MEPPTHESPEELAFLFDLGNVLIHCDFEWGAHQLAKESPLTAPEIVHRFEMTNLICDFDQGKFDAITFAAHVRQIVKWKGDIESLERIWQEMLSPDEEMLGLVERLQTSGYRTFVLSNINPFHTSHVRRAYPQILKTHGVVFSCECALVKPDVAIFHHTATSLSLDPARTLFIDDREDNIVAASFAGYQVWHHTDRERTREEIARRTGVR